MERLYETVFSGALLALLVAAPLPSLAQGTPQAPTAAEAQAALNPSSHFTPAQLDQMLAPVALYPDQLLTQVLMASTFPQQLVDAQNWLQDSHNASLKGDDLANALTPLPWDPSVKSLVAFPQLIAMMVAHLDWTQALGASFANEQVQVFARVQFLRNRAKQAGFLKSSSQIAVSEQASDIIITAADPNEVFVPVYNPADVYGSWPDNDYPPVFLPPPPGFYSGPIPTGIGFSVGFGIVAPLWGWGHPDWRHHTVTIDPARYEHITTRTYIQENHINIQGGAWHRSGAVVFVPEAQRPRPTYQSNEAPRGTVQPAQAFRPAAAGARPAGAAQPASAAQPAGAAQPAAHPANEAAHPANEAAHPANEAAHPANEARPNEAAPGPHPAGQAQPAEHPANEAAHPGEHAAPTGPHPAGEAAHPGEHAAPTGPHPAGEAAHPEEHAAPTGPHPAGEAAHPAEEHAPAAAPHPAGEAAHPAEEHAPAAAPQQHAAPAAHPEEHAPAAAPQEHAAPAPHPEEHAPPAAPHPEEHAAPPAPAPHPPAPPPHPAPEAHPAPPHPAGPPPKPGEEKKPDDQPQH